ncbi:HpcH/HpaI aldolase/citrate lyase family protein [Streptomyces fuscichromogenes]|uniref:CoA ester lyase n=1 Tax=Streptomyces fuscichromogenes TaxID=1324013 RepID=A0A917XN12_9ACTN|nr:CoA ester lyase [Streptomyces fuscichromogenes]GGN41006.1 CoA ester lyase [Streptomyces fuscichromogenes]
MNRPAPQPLRAWLITPALNADRFEKATSCGADVALADLEDSVALADKAAARASAARFLYPAADGGPVLGLRVNAPVTADGVHDLAAITGYPCQPGIVLVSKVESARDIEVVAGALDTGGHAPVLYALIETPRAIDRLPAIVKADRLGGLLFGAADYAALTGCARTWEALLYARSAVANTAGAAGIPAIDSPYFDVQDLDGLHREAERARSLGFQGKGAVHPRQIPVITRAFTPSAEEVAAAQAVVAAGHEASAAVTTVGGQMVGPPLLTAAQAVVDRAAASRS